MGHVSCVDLWIWIWIYEIMKFCAEIHGSQRMNPTDFGDP